MKAVVFDFGGVMTTSTMPLCVMDAVNEFGLPWEAVTRGFMKYRHAYDGGDISIRELYERTWSDAGISVTPEMMERMVKADRASWLRRNERTLEWMKSLKAEGRRIGILTNMAPDFAPVFKEHFADFIALSDALVISGLEHMHKPNREIYDLLRSRIALPAADLVFIDDIAENCAGARAAGWNAIQFISNDQVEQQFRNNYE